MASSVFIGYFGGVKYSTSGASVSIAASWLPDADNTYDLGSASFQWRTAYLGTSAILADAGTLQFGTTTPAILSRGAANRLDLASGDSLYLVSGGLGVGVTNTTAGRIQANEGVFAAGGGFFGFSGRSYFKSPADGQVVVVSNAETTASALGLGPVASATSTYKLVKKVTGIADNTATNILTVTIPDANHAATVKVTLLSSNGSTDAFESSRTAEGSVVVARTTGANAVATASTLTLTAIATVSGGATHTLAYNVSAIAGAVDAANTFTIQVTIDDTGNLGANQCVVLAELINAEASGVTIA